MMKPVIHAGTSLNELADILAERRIELTIDIDPTASIDDRCGCSIYSATFAGMTTGFGSTLPEAIWMAITTLDARIARREKAKTAQQSPILKRDA